MFNRLYKHYKDDWSLEMRLWKANKTYEEAYAEMNKNEEWF